MCSAGYEARHVAEIGLRGATDEEVLAHAETHDEVLITNDLDFSDERVLPEAHPGIIVLRVWPNISPELMISEVTAAIRALDVEDIAGNIVVMEPGNTRIRRKQP
jgi:predicted nuclease of predicted toxin-antitoxin system